jgi:hypothetical protein
MKKIKLFENFDSRKKFSEIVDDVFSSIEDDPKWGNEITISDEEYLNELSNNIGIYISIGDNLDAQDFSEYFKKLELRYEIYSKVNSCIEMLKKFMDKDLGIEYYDNDEAVEIYLYEVEKAGEFWKKQQNGEIKLEYKKILELVDAPKQMKISTSSDGRNYFLQFSLPNKQQLDDFNAEELNSKLKKLEVEGESLVEPFYPYYPPDKLVDFKKSDRDYHSSHGQEKKFLIEFKINSKINFSW